MATGHEPTPDAIADQRNLYAEKIATALGDLLPDRAAPADAYTTLDPYVRTHIAAHLADSGRTGELLERPGLL